MDWVDQVQYSWLGGTDDTDMKATRYFLYTRSRPDRANIQDEWIVRAIQHPLREERQADGRTRRWARIAEMDE